MASETPSSNARGWVVTFCALGVNLVLGVLYAWSPVGRALGAGWAKTYGKAVAQTLAAVPFAASTVAFAITMIFAGRIQDKIGPRLVAMLGGFMLGLGLIASAYATSPLALALTYGLLGGMGIGLGYSATTPSSIKWFPPAMKGLITGIVVAGVGLAAVYMAPLTTFMLGVAVLPDSLANTLGLVSTTVTTPAGIKTLFIAQTFFILGVGTIVIVGILSQLLRNPPAGYVPPAMAQAAAAAKRPAAGLRRDIDWPQMLRTPQFYLLWVMFVLTVAPGLMLIANAAQIAEKQVGWKDAGFVPVMVLAIFNTCGRIVGGFVSDRIGRTNTMMLAFLLQAANMFAFSFYGNWEALIFGVAFAGLCYGTIFTLMPAGMADFYGVKNLGVNYGLLFTAFGVAGATGSLLGGRTVDLFGSYNRAYIILGVMLLVATALGFITRAMKKPAEALAPAQVAA